MLSNTVWNYKNEGNKMKKFLIGIVIALLGLLPLATSSIASETATASPSQETTIEGEREENSTDSSKGKLDEVVINYNTTIYISPDLNQEFDKGRIVEYAKTIQKVSEEDDITLPRLVVSEITEEEIDEQSSDAVWATKKEKTSIAIQNKFSSYLPQDENGVLFLMKKDDGKFELYSYTSSEESGSTKLVVNDAFENVNDVNTAVEVVIDQDIKTEIKSFGFLAICGIGCILIIAASVYSILLD